MTITDEALRVDHRRVHARGRRAQPRAADRHHRAQDRGARRDRHSAGDRSIVEADELEAYLGPARFKREIAFRTSRPGVATGVAWTETGGDVLFIEASLLPGGRGQFILTGQLGDVMQESARAAVSHIRANAAELGVASELPRGPRPARARAGRRDSERRPVGRRDDGDGDSVGGAQRAGAAPTWR